MFAAVRADDSPTGEMALPGARPEERTAAVATSEREAPTETIATTDDDARTEVIRADTDAKHATPSSETEKD